MSELKPTITLAITGASGVVYAQRFLELSLDKFSRIYLIVSDSAKGVINHELTYYDSGFCLRKLVNENSVTEYSEVIRLFENDNLWAPIASGSSVADQMIILPCSMGSLARVTGGLSSNLIERAADVCLKQGKKLVVCPRETPFNQIHLENMLALNRAGAMLVPLMPAFYNNPKSQEELIDFMVGRIFEVLDLKHDLYRPWNSRMR